jgi:hypothetical protein
MADDNSGFKVADRRLFTSEGELRETSESVSDHGFDAVSPKLGVGEEANPPMSFQALIFSLSTTALLQLGVAPHPSSGKQENDIQGAKQTIEILEILQQKTKGNLTPEEVQLLDDCLCDLKMTYVKVVQEKKR